MDLAYTLKQAPLPVPVLDDLQTLAGLVFGCRDPDDTWRINNMPDFTCFEARDGADLVGFKMGYAHTRRRYYSWLGGVHPDYRGRGIARRLMGLQHQWLVQQGYTSVETGARDDNLAMIQLNLSSGFTRVGSRLKGQQSNTVLEKQLSSAP